MVPSFFGKFCENFHSRRSKHATSATSWYRAFLDMFVDASMADSYTTWHSRRQVTSFASERRLMENADERLRQPEQGGRFETAWVVCARLAGFGGSS